jgi:hypothetical protein
MNDNIASEWAAFSALILDPVQAGPTQRQECRRAFYAGAIAMFQLVSEASAHPSEDVCVLNMELLNREIQQWTEMLQTGRA